MADRKKKSGSSKKSASTGSRSAGRSGGRAGGRSAGRGSSSTRGGASRRGGFGDDQGTRIGSPTPGARQRGRPSSQPVSEGLEGSVLDDDAEPRSARGARSGAGAEAAQGITAVTGQRGGEPRPGSRVRGGRRSNVTQPRQNTVEHPGSQPLEGRTVEHESGYGGRGGEPRESSDQRE